MRWCGPNGPVSLADIRQAGATGVVSILHQLASGKLWPLDEIERQVNILSDFGLLSRFVGMRADLCSFFSFSRHEYFCRLLCDSRAGIRSGDWVRSPRWPLWAGW